MSQISASIKPKLSLVVLTRYGALIIAAITYVWISFHVGVDTKTGGPDEIMRSLIPSCMIQGKLLPSGYDPCAIYSIGNWSYAFYPQMLGAYVSAAFMAAFKLFSAPMNVVFMSGRLASTLFSLIALYALSKAAEYAFESRHDKWLIQLTPIIFVGFWPQFIFLSSYMNNESVAFAGVSIMTMSTVRGVKKGWDVKSSVILALGVAITGLGYLNAYGFIFASVLIFSITLFIQNSFNQKQKIKLFVLAAGLAAILIFPFFITNWIRYGDPIGTTIFQHRQALWVSEHGIGIQHPWDKGIRELLFHSTFTEQTLMSFVGMFGYMAQPLPFTIELMYIFVAITGFGASIKMILQKLSDRRILVFILGMALGVIITVLLFFLYILRTDYQPQGRYTIYLLIPLALAVMTGISSIIEGQGRVVRSVMFILEVMYMLFGAYLLIHLANNYNWVGVSGWPL